ncbi:MAG: 16S rRNA (adenine(1518)-N(6)/adenine(1519)-N(6))-dimethyltransferase [Alphaproteobacteria bacterium]|nr:MAG: 16S rRNA (adenine(1518)-N(6)/adenine(1519)-N(6))-dimethyltransferase [Alphaproteobacteria bacterium]
MGVDLKARITAIEALPPLRDVIAQHELSAQKALGQNFLLDMNITDKIVREALARDGDDWHDVHAFEIGPGPGGLTRSLLKSPAKKVHAIELDRRAVAALDGLVQAACGDLDVLQCDAMKEDLTMMADAPRVIVANLPYNIATPLLIGWLRQTRGDFNAYKSMTLMFQKEVADRMVATPDCKTYGRLSVITQWLCNVSVIYDLPPSAFTPPPKVMSAVVHFSPRELPADAPDFRAVERVTAAAFNQRRKMIRSSLKEYMPAIEALGINPQLRAENLSVQDYINISSV